VSTRQITMSPASYCPCKPFFNRPYEQRLPISLQTQDSSSENLHYPSYAMPPERSASKTKTFKPQRPSTGASSSRAKSKSIPTSSHTTIETQSSRPTQPDADEDGTALEPPTETLPAALLTTLLQEFFTDDRTRISKGADKAVGKYMETFVREAIARAAYERSSGEERGDGFLEVRLELGRVNPSLMISQQVEDLEKLAPQLVLDF
jgi:centromere protein X